MSLNRHRGRQRSSERAVREAEMDEVDLLDPNPDIHALFMHYNDLYFEGKLGACSVAWSSSRMTLCAGICQFAHGRGCAIRLSQPLLKYRCVADLKDTLLHEMIHAFLFLTDGNKDHDDHGPSFRAKMVSINNSSVLDFEKPKRGYRISVYHSFKDEVDNYRVHHWTCFTCGNVVKRAMNRAPSLADCRYPVLDAQACSDTRCSWHMHEKYCGGNYVKTAQPSNYVDRRKCSKDARREENSAAVSEGCKQTNDQKSKSHSNVKENNTDTVPLQNSRIERFFCSKNLLRVDGQLNSQGDAEVIQLRNEENNTVEFMEDVDVATSPIEGHAATPEFEKIDKFHSEEKPEQDTPKQVVQQSPDNVKTRKRKIQLLGSEDVEEPDVIIAWKGWWAVEDKEDEATCKLINRRQRKQVHDKFVRRVEHIEVLNESEEALDKSEGAVLVDKSQAMSFKASVKLKADLYLDKTCFQEEQKAEGSCVHIISSQSDPEGGDAQNVETLIEATTHCVEDALLSYRISSLDQMAEMERCHQHVDLACIGGSSGLDLDLMKKDTISFSGNSAEHEVPSISANNDRESSGEGARLVLEFSCHEQSDGSVGTLGEHPKQDVTMRCPFCDKVLMGDINNYQTNEIINNHIDACLAST